MLHPPVRLMLLDPCFLFYHYSTADSRTEPTVKIALTCQSGNGRLSGAEAPLGRVATGPVLGYVIRRQADRVVLAPPVELSALALVPAIVQVKRVQLR